MINPTIISLAFLKVNWDEQRKDYIDNFVPIVAECLRIQEEDIVSAPLLHDNIKKQFGLTIPINVLKLILNRVCKKGYIDRKEYVSHECVYHLNRENLSQLNFCKIQQEVVRKYEYLINDFTNYCYSEHKQTIDKEYAEKIFLACVQEMDLKTITLNTARETKDTELLREQDKYLIGKYIQKLLEENSSLFNDFEILLKGNFLANAVYLPDPMTSQRRFKKTSVYFDTRFLLNALGYSDEIRREPCIELMDILYEDGADLYCFNHTATEIYGILRAAADQIGKKEDMKQRRDTSFTTLEHFLFLGYSPSDIEMCITTLEDDLEAIGISIEEKPKHIKAFSINETKLEEILIEKIRYRGLFAVRHDVDSIAAIMRIREGRQYSHIEDCRAIFVTTNRPLSNMSNNFLIEQGYFDSVVPIITDDELTCLLWLKTPTKLPDLPRKRIIADCYAATQPDDRLWNKYLYEIERLNREESISPDNYYLLRYSLEAKSALMEMTLGEEEAFTQGTVPEILDMTRNRISSERTIELSDKLEEERKSREEKENQLLQRKEKDTSIINNIKSIAKKKAKFWTIILKCIVLVVLAGILLISILKYPSKYVIIFDLIIAFATFYSFWKGKPIDVLSRKFSKFYEKRIENKLRSIAGI